MPSSCAPRPNSPGSWRATHFRTPPPTTRALAVFFLAGPPKDAGWLADHPGPERLSISGLDLYADYPGEIGTTKLPPARIEKRLGVVTTFRNWNTLVRLLKSAETMAGGR